MFPEAVVEHFNILEHIRAKLCLIGKNMIANGAAFVSAIEGFHGRVVVAVSLRAHARFHAQVSNSG